MANTKRADIDLRSATTAVLEDLVRMWRTDAEALAALTEERMADGSATAQEVEALVAHRNLLQLI